jgi:hypothetical protein
MATEPRPAEATKAAAPPPSKRFSRSAPDDRPARGVPPKRGSDDSLIRLYLAQMRHRAGWSPRR